MSSEKRDPKQEYGNTIMFAPENLDQAIEALYDNLRESLPKEMSDKAHFFISWKYIP